MSTKASTFGERGKRGGTTSTEPSNNPFDTVFDGEESDGEWWDDEESVPTNASKSEARTTQWPRIGDGAKVGTIKKPPSRINTRKADKRYSVQKPTRDKSRGRQKKQNALAGIKVITNFSKPVLPAADPAQLQLPEIKLQKGCFVDLAALQALNGEAPQPVGGFWKSTRNKGTANGPDTITPPSSETSQPLNSRQLNANPPERLKPRAHIPSPLDLSPSDRPIVIGISIPSARLAEHTLSPETATSTISKNHGNYERRTPTNMVPETPTIIITPAHAGSIWSALDDNSAGPNLGPSSSIYTQPPHNVIGVYNKHNAPPVPRMPASVLETERQRIAAQKSYFSPDSDEGTTWGDETPSDYDIKSRSRAFSTGTVFEEDESPVIARRGRAVSISTGPKDLKHASISTVATPRRSRGWWNYITTPFLTRSNTVASRGVFEDQQPPALPNLAIAAAKAQDAARENNQWEKQFSPLTPETTTTISSEAWWDTSAKEDQSKYFNTTTQSPIVSESRHKAEDSTGTLPFFLSEAAVMGMNTMPPSSPVNTEAHLQTPSVRSIDNNRELPMQSNTTSRQNDHTNNPFSQPQLADLNNQRNVSQAEQQTVPSASSRGPVLASPPPPYTPAASRVPRYRAVLPPDHVQNLQYPSSPGPLSPGLQQAMSSTGGIPMSDVPLTPAARRPINLNSQYTQSITGQTPMTFDPPPLQPFSSKAQKAEAKRRRHEKEDAVARRAGGWWRGRGCIPDSGCYGRSGPEGRKKRRWYFGLIVGFLAMMIVVISLATTLHRKSNTVIGPSQWVNLTGFPPIFTGLSTIASPVNLQTNTGCVFPATQWSCDLPKELQASVAPNPSNQPNFLLQIQWDNSSETNATFSNVTGNPNLVTRNSVGNPVSAGQFIRSLLLKSRQIVTFVPNPAPPSFAEEYFLGNTTDGIVSENKAGEPTPFYISFLSPTDSSFTKRQVLARASTQFPNVSNSIPAPSLNSDGTAAPANLLPLPLQQPIRLYDRGLPTEHYGFYTYFDRSIFLKSITPLNQTNIANGAVPDDEGGGSTEKEASFRCTWAETRFLVQMWTRMNSTSKLLNSTSSGTSSGLNFTQPGTFPYPATITIDRHGGDATRKMLYCYDMDTREGIISSGKHLVGENREFGGSIINPAAQIFLNESDPNLGGFDGGTGGCSCQWSNFQKVV